MIAGIQLWRLDFAFTQRDGISGWLAAYSVSVEFTGWVVVLMTILPPAGLLTAVLT
jgi:hypothetical protein